MNFNTITKTEMFNYVNGIVELAPYYMWGFDMQPITEAAISDHIKKYGSEKYTDWKKKVGFYGCDCSGLFTPILGCDKSAAGYYAECTDAGVYKHCPSDYAFVFRKNSSGKVVHMGVLIGGYTYEMYNRCDKKAARGGNWTHYGIHPALVQETTVSPNYTVSEDGEKVMVYFTMNGYSTAVDAIAERNSKAVVPCGNYFVYKVVDIEGTKCYNISSRKGIPGAWITP